MRKVLISGLAALAAAVIAAAPASAQAWDYFVMSGESAQTNLTAISTHTPMLVRYVGATSTGGTVTVAAGGDISLANGPVGGSVADTTLECPVVGALGGVIDVSDAACDTLGEVCDVLNKSPNWRCVLLDGMAADSSNNTLAALAETAANSPNGLALLADTAVTFDAAAELTPERTMKRFLDGRAQFIAPNPSASSRVALFAASATSTYGAGTSNLEVFSCKTLYPSRWQASTFATAAGWMATENMSESCVQLENVAGGATTVQKEFAWTFGLEGRKGDRLLIRLNNSADMTAVQLTAYARVVPLK